MTNELKPCPFCGGEVYYRVTRAGVTFFSCIHCNAGVTFSSAIEALPSEKAKQLFNRRTKESK
jgi:ribosomal protein L37AE/L43A